MSRSNADRVENSIKHIRVARSHLDRGSLDDLLIFDAVCLRLSSSIEEISPIDGEILEAVFGDSWHLIRAMRNTIVHNYEYVSPAAIERTMEEEIPEFIASLEAMREQV